MSEDSAAQAFRRRPERVRAAQWRGDNAEELATLAGPDFDYGTVGGDDVGAALRTSKHSSWEPMYIGDWAVRGPGGSLARVDAQDFATQYEPVAPVAAAVLPEPDYLPGYPGKLADRPAWPAPEPKEWTAGETETYRPDHCGNCRDAEFYGYPGKLAENAHAKHVQVIEDRLGPLAGLPCKCKACVPAESEAADD